MYIEKKKKAMSYKIIFNKIIIEIHLKKNPDEYMDNWICDLWDNIRLSYWARINPIWDLENETALLIGKVMYMIKWDLRNRIKKMKTRETIVRYFEKNYWIKE